MEDIYGGTWGVLIIKDPSLVSNDIHWTIPDHKHRDGSSAFCLSVTNNWQYNIFKTGSVDTLNRFTVEEVVSRIRNKKITQKFTKDLFSRRVADFATHRRPSQEP
uniref:ULP_PROTEASE domain-containing protein n=1 Tax=Steinernema glaseri TaxID=37863 RepID=A0A1I8A9T3_9BILA